MSYTNISAAACLIMSMRPTAALVFVHIVRNYFMLLQLYLEQTPASAHNCTLQ